MTTVSEWFRRLWDVLKSRPLAILGFLLGLILMIFSVNGVAPFLNLSEVGTRYFATLGTALAFVAGVAAFFVPSEGKHPVGYLLVEHGYLSLGRTQAFIWLIPSVAIYGGMMLPHLSLQNFPSALFPILGGSLGTAVLGAATAPSKTTVDAVDAEAAQAKAKAAENDTADKVLGTISGTMPMTPDQKAEARKALIQAGILPAAPAAQVPAGPVGAPEYRLIHLVEDFRGQGDITRYQFLFLTVLGAGLLLASYLVSGQLPDKIPPDLLYLMGGSALCYVGTKTVKTVALENEMARKR